MSLLYRGCQSHLQYLLMLAYTCTFVTFEKREYECVSILNTHNVIFLNYTGDFSILVDVAVLVHPCTNQTALFAIQNQRKKFFFISIDNALYHSSKLQNSLVPCIHSTLKSIACDANASVHGTSVRNPSLHSNFERHFASRSTAVSSETYESSMEKSNALSSLLYLILSANFAAI